MKVVIAGLGSIGQRHARNLRALFGAGVEIVAYRVRGLPHTITEDMTIDATQPVESALGIRRVDSLDRALDGRPEAVLICNPTSLHLSTAWAAIERGCHVLVEKPLSHSCDGVDELIACAERRGVIAAVGYQLRAHPALRRVRDLLGADAIGPLVSVRAEMGEYLPDAHPYEDYRTSYAARAEQGGGVLLCLAHEFDYLSWFFGCPSAVYAAGGTFGDLGVDVEDTALTTCVFERDGRTLPAQVHHTFLQRRTTRSCQLVGQHGQLDVDLVDGTLTIVGPDRQAVVERHHISRNDLFLSELRQFFAATAGTGRPLATMREAAVSLRIVLAAKRSIAASQVERLCPQ